MDDPQTDDRSGLDRIGSTDDPGYALGLMRGALVVAAGDDDAPAMARLLRRCVQEELIPRSSPLEAVRTGPIERAWQIADLADAGRSYGWHVLLAWELYETGRADDARASMKRIQERALPHFHEHEGA